LIIAHRGASGNAPENTIAAFSLAVDQGADVIDLDVHMTADGYPVVIHDATLDRTTDGTGLVRSRTLAELRRLDAGSWFHNRFAGERVPTLEEVVEWAKDRIALSIEVKSTPSRYRGIEASVTGVLERQDAVLDHEVFSLDHLCMTRFKAREPRLLTGVRYSADPVDHNALATAAGATVLHPMLHYLRPDAVRDAHAASLLVFAQTVDEPQDIRDMAALGVDGITTNFPSRAKEIVRG
jgi:glycerophosphoryl diester phosphodiesterase